MCDSIPLFSFRRYIDQSGVLRNLTNEKREQVAIQNLPLQYTVGNKQSSIYSIDWATFIL